MGYTLATPSGLEESIGGKEMTWTMLTIVVNLYGGQPVVLPGYEYTSEEACKAQLYASHTERDDSHQRASIVFTAAIAASAMEPSGPPP